MKKYIIGLLLSGIILNATEIEATDKCSMIVKTINTSTDFYKDKEVLKVNNISKESVANYMEMCNEMRSSCSKKDFDANQKCGALIIKNIELNNVNVLNPNKKISID